MPPTAPSGRFSANAGNASGDACDVAAAAARARRKLEAEKILEEIAREYAAKRAAGLVPSVPVPARTLLWEELERRERSRVGRRGMCVFGRDAPAGACGCTRYKRLAQHTGGLCARCGHGGPWHRLTGGSNAARASNGATRSFAGSSVRASRVSRSDAPSQRSLVLSEYTDDDAYDDDEYDDEYDEYDDDDDDDDDDDIALEVARPYASYPNPNPNPHLQNQFASHHQHYHPAPPPPPPADEDAELRDSLLRNSLLSTGSSSLGLPPRNSSGAPQLDALLRAINRYRQLGLSEDEVERRIAVEFPPAPRRSSVRASYVSGELASI